MEKRGKNCTIRELAGYVGLSTCTVSKVLNDPTGELAIPEGTRRKVREAARELNYVPNVNAQRFFKRRSQVIGLLVPPQDEMGHNVFHDTHFVEILSGIERALSTTSYNLLLLFNRPEYKEGNRYAGMFRSGFVDGLLIWGAHRSEGYWQELVELTQPRIFLTSTPDFSPDEPLHYVASDYEQSAYGVVSRLKAQGCRRFCWLAGMQDTSIISQLSAGMKRAGLLLEESAIRYSDYIETDGERLAAELLDQGEFDAVLATAPQLARGAVRYIEAHRLPVQVGSFDGQRVTRLPSDHYISALTNDVEIGLKAMEKMFSLIEGSTETVQIKVPVDFTTKERSENQ